MSKIIKEALTFAQRYRGKLIVINISPSVISNKKRLFNVLKDIAVIKQAGIKLAIFHSTPRDKNIWKDLGDVNFREHTDGWSFFSMGSGNSIVHVQGTDDSHNDLLTVIKAMDLGAEKIIFVTNYDGVFGKKKNLLGDLTVKDCEKLLEGQKQDGELAGKLKAAIYACKKPEVRVHVIGSREGALAREIFTAEGSGTMICDQLYYDFRQADDSDVSDVHGVIRASVSRAALPFDTLLSDIKSFTVLTVDGEVHGCYSVKEHSYADGVEIKHLGASARFETSEIFQRIVDKILDDFKDKKLVIVDPATCSCWLSIYPWFSGVGFKDQQDKEVGIQTSSPKHIFARLAQ